jgi:hypothetical protein
MGTVKMALATRLTPARLSARNSGLLKALKLLKQVHHHHSL